MSDLRELPSFEFSTELNMLTVLELLLQEIEHDSDDELFEGEGKVREFFDPTVFTTNVFPETKKSSKKGNEGLKTIFENRKAEEKREKVFDDFSDFSHCYNLMTGEKCGDIRRYEREDGLATPFYYTSCYYCQQMAPGYLSLSFMD